MRDIKFRVYNPRDKKIHYDITGFEFLTNGDMSGVFIDGVFFLIEEVDLMQYTGLKDKNGKEIYEGDIIHIPDNWEEYGWASGENYSIDFKEGRFRLKPKYKPNAIGYDLENTEELEVIGNIYENKDLLEKGKEE